MKPGSPIFMHHGRHAIVLALVSGEPPYHSLSLEALWIIFWDIQLHISSYRSDPENNIIRISIFQPETLTQPSNVGVRVLHTIAQHDNSRADTLQISFRTCYGMWEAATKTQLSYCLCKLKPEHLITLKSMVIL